MRRMLPIIAQLYLEAAKREVVPLLRDPAAVEIWSKEFFQSLLPRLKVES
jgi:hypothetical protein